MKTIITPTWNTAEISVTHKRKEYNLEVNINLATKKFSITEPHEEGIVFENDFELAEMKLKALNSAIRYISDWL